MTCFDSGSFFVVRLLKRKLLMKTNNVNNISFTNSCNIGLGLRTASKICSIQEGGAGLSNIRFIQDSATGLLPKAVFARSKADLGENIFLELSESILVYYCPAILGEKFFRKIFSKKLPNNLKKSLSTPASELLKSGNITNNKKIIPVKAAIALGAFAIPLVEFSLNYIKNLMTLKVFKQSNFDSIANLNKNKAENKKQAEYVENSARRNISRAGFVYAFCLALAGILFSSGEKSKALQNLSELIVAPGTKLFKRNEKLKNFFNKFLSIDFANDNGKLSMSRGQLTSCVLVGGAGYFGASKDRGKQNFLETVFRYPVVGFYIIYGNELLEKGFRKLLYKTGRCKEVLNDRLEVPRFDQLREYSEKFCGRSDELYKKILKQKILIAGVPLLFGIGFMGFFIAGTSNLFTKFRYNREQNKYSKVNMAYRVKNPVQFQSQSIQNVRYNNIS